MADEQEPYHCSKCHVQHRPGTKVYEEHLQFREEEDEKDISERVDSLERTVGKLVKDLPKILEEQVIVHKYEIGHELGFVLFFFALAVMFFAISFGG